MNHNEPRVLPYTLCNPRLVTRGSSFGTILIHESIQWSKHLCNLSRARYAVHEYLQGHIKCYGNYSLSCCTTKLSTIDNFPTLVHLAQRYITHRPLSLINASRHRIIQLTSSAIVNSATARENCSGLVVDTPSSDFFYSYMQWRELILSKSFSNASQVITTIVAGV